MAAPVEMFLVESRLGHENLLLAYPFASLLVQIAMFRIESVATHHGVRVLLPEHVATSTVPLSGRCQSGRG
jgi:hypothetical protein